MPNIDVAFLRVATLYVIVGVLMVPTAEAIGMHIFTLVHAHLNLLGWVTLGLYGLAHRAWPVLRTSKLAKTQFYFACATPALLAGGFLSEALGVPALAALFFAGWIGALVSMILFAVMVFGRRMTASASTLVHAPAE